MKMRLFDQAIEVREQSQKPATEPSLKLAKPRPKIIEEGSLRSHAKGRTIVPTPERGNDILSVPATVTAPGPQSLSDSAANTYVACSPAIDIRNPAQTEDLSVRIRLSDSQVLLFVQAGSADHVRFN